MQSQILPSRAALVDRIALQFEYGQTEEAPRDVLERLAEEREPLYKEVADFVVRTDEQSAKVVANQIIEKLDF